MDSQNHHNDQPVKACFSIIGYALLMSGLGCCIKHISKELSFEVIVFFRNCFALVVLLLLNIWRNRRQKRSQNKSADHSRERSRTTIWNLLVPRTGKIHLHLLRSVFGVSAMYCFFYTLGKMPLAEATLLSYTSPFFMPLFALLWLKEPISVKGSTAVLLGFLGILLILRPGTGIINIISFIGIGAGVSVALAAVTIRRMSGSESPGTMVFYFTLIATLISAVPLAWSWQGITLYQLVLLMVMGTVAVTGQFLMAQGYALAPAAKVGPFTYFTVFFSSVWGWVIWGESLDAFFFSGAVLICFSGILAGQPHREKPL